MLTFATLVGFAALAVTCIITAAFTGPLGNAADRDNKHLRAWSLIVLTVCFIAAGIIAAGGAFATLAKAVQS